MEFLHPKVLVTRLLSFLQEDPYLSWDTLSTLLDNSSPHPLLGQLSIQDFERDMEGVVCSFHFLDELLMPTHMFFREKS
jgi:hypothetical protein